MAPRLAAITVSSGARCRALSSMPMEVPMSCALTGFTGSRYMLLVPWYSSWSTPRLLQINALRSACGIRQNTSRVMPLNRPW